MGKSSNFVGQPIYGQLIKSLDREKIVEMSRRHGGENYVKSFDGYTHLLTMLYAVIQRFDSLREIETSMTAEVRKLHHVGIDTVPKRSTLSDANARRPEKFFENVYRNLYEANKDILSSDSRRNGTEEWIKRLRIIDSTTVSLFSNAIFKGVGRHPKTGKKKGGIKDTRQRGRTLRRTVHIGGYKRLVHARSSPLQTRRDNGYGPRLHQLCQVRGAD